MLCRLRRFQVDESGASSIEYALIATMIALVIISGATLVGENLTTPFDTAANAV